MMFSFTTTTARGRGRGSSDREKKMMKSLLVAKTKVLEIIIDKHLHITKNSVSFCESNKAAQGRMEREESEREIKHKYKCKYNKEFEEFNKCTIKCVSL